MMSKIIALSCCVAVATAYSDAEIKAKGLEVLEEYRKDRGHWVHLRSSSAVDHIPDHVGPKGFGVAGFFITKHKDGETEPYKEDNFDWLKDEQEEDQVFQAFKELALNQKWLDHTGLQHKKWTFGYSHDKKIAEESGCEGVGTLEWNHVCIIVWKSSSDGTRLSTHKTTHFGLDASNKKLVPGPEHIKKFILDNSRKTVAGTEEL